MTDAQIVGIAMGCMFCLGMAAGLIVGYLLGRSDGRSEENEEWMNWFVHETDDEDFETMPPVMEKGLNKILMKKRRKSLLKRGAGPAKSA